MMRMLAIVVLVVVSACASGSRVNRAVGRAALVTSTLALVCDGMQTVSMAGRGWPVIDGRQKVEGNPIMGERPSVAVVGGYFVGAILLNAAAWVVTPERFRAPLPAAVTAVQAGQIAANSSGAAGVCGF